MKQAVYIFLLLIVLPLSLLAKRTPPKAVTPVEANGVRYSVSGDRRDQYVVATETSSGKELWKTKVFHNDIDSGVEEDVQWVFITNLKLTNDSLLAKDEKSRCYSISLKTHRARKQLWCDADFR
jgi:hypothetical protein